jgi:hypothetical protein
MSDLKRIPASCETSKVELKEAGCKKKPFFSPKKIKESEN